MFRNLLLLLSGGMLISSDSNVSKSIGAALVASGLIRVADQIDNVEVRPPTS